MRALQAAVSTLALVASMSTLGATASGANLKSTLQARYTEMKTAIAARDSKEVAALLASGFSSIDVNGQSENSGQMLQEISALPADPNKSSDTTLVSVKQQGTIATVIQRYQMETIRPVPGKAITQNVELIATSTDTWTEVAGTWLLKETRTDEMSYMIDGKLVIHKRHATEQQ